MREWPVRASHSLPHLARSSGRRAGAAKLADADFGRERGRPVVAVPVWTAWSILASTMPLALLIHIIFASSPSVSLAAAWLWPPPLLSRVIRPRAVLSCLDVSGEWGSQ